jgi:BASS family bile acid:Na+ symporter
VSEYVELVTKLANLTMLVFMVSNMLAFGMRLSPSEIIAPLRDGKHDVKIFLANFVMIPGFAYALLYVLHIQGGPAIAILLLASSAGDPAVTKVSALSKGDPAYTLAAMMAVQIVTILYMPIVLPALLSGVHVNPLGVAKPLVLFLLLPLVLGSLVRARWTGFAARLWKPLDAFSSLAVVIAIVLFLVRYSKEMISQSALVIAALSAFVVFGLVVGYVLGAPGQVRRSDLALNVSIRGVSAAVAVAITNFPGQMEIISVVILGMGITVVTVGAASTTVLRRLNVAARSRPVSSDGPARAGIGR